MLGLLGAFSWAVHDLCVRKVSATQGAFPPLVSVLVLGSLVALPLTLIWAEPATAPPGAYWRAIAAGVFYAVAGVGLYKALGIGPVRLVAPIIGAYPIVSMGLAAYSGSPLTIVHWLAVFVVIGGVAFIAISSDEGASDGDKAQAIGWSLLSGPGFAIAFALSQSATMLADEWTMLMPMRIAAIAATLLLALALREGLLPQRKSLWIFLIMGTLDVIAIVSVSAAGSFAYPEFAAVAASTFGLITVVLATIFLGERLRAPQWTAVVAVFAAIGSLGL
ncbi:DMT family transporter [Rhodobacteraceae bacterium N5(2021)]|nr:DMT family transporter [Gymnodinialimonas phycosphaerae]MBY4892001.1 DMT family transporter [Gymnodinialimonas phycosphaerae]